MIQTGNGEEIKINETENVNMITMQCINIKLIMN